MRSKSMTQKNMILKIITTPYRAFCKAKDFYIKSITDCANHTTYGRAAMTTGHPLSRTTSTTSFGSTATEDLRELIRANSTANIDDLNISKEDLELYIKQHMMINKQSMVMDSRKVPRSVSVGMVRIDEDAPVNNFEKEDVEVLGRKSDNYLVFPRSKSHVVTSSAKINRFS